MGREDDLDDEEYQVREVYAQYGLSSYPGQVMEKGVVNLPTLHANVESGNPSQQGFDALFDKFARYTLGWLIMTVERAGTHCPPYLAHAVAGFGRRWVVYSCALCWSSSTGGHTSS